MTSIPDHCIRSAQQQDSAAQARLWQHLRPLLLRYVNRRLSDAARRWIDPEDLVSAVLTETLTYLSSHPDPPIQEQELLRRTRQLAKHRIIDSVRRHAGELGESVLEAPPSATSPVSEATGVVTRDDMQLWVAHLVDALPAQYRDIVQMRLLNARSFASIAEELRTKETTIRKRYERVLRILQQRARKGHP